MKIPVWKWCKHMGAIFIAFRHNFPYFCGCGFSLLSIHYSWYYEVSVHKRPICVIWRKYGLKLIAIPSHEWVLQHPCALIAEKKRQGTSITQRSGVLVGLGIENKNLNHAFVLPINMFRKLLGLPLWAPNTNEVDISVVFLWCVVYCHFYLQKIHFLQPFYFFKCITCWALIHFFPCTCWWLWLIGLV